MFKPQQIFLRKMFYLGQIPPIPTLDKQKLMGRPPEAVLAVGPFSESQEELAGEDRGRVGKHSNW